MKGITLFCLVLSAVCLLISSFIYLHNDNLISELSGRVQHLYTSCLPVQEAKYSDPVMLDQGLKGHGVDSKGLVQVQPDSLVDTVEPAPDSELRRRQLTIPGLFTIPALPTISIPGIPGLSPATTSSSTPADSTTNTKAPAQTSTSSVQTTTTTKASSILDSLGILGGTSGSSSNSSNPFQQLGDLFSNGLSGIGNAILGSFDIPAFFLGVGLATGGVSALNLTTHDRAKAIATQVASANGQSPTGMNEVAMNLGDGLAEVAIPVVYSSDKPLDLTKIAPYAFPFAQGIGNGSLIGLDVSLVSFSPSTGASMTNVVSNVALGLSESVARNLDIKKILDGIKSQPLEIPSSIDLKLVLEQAGEGLSQGVVVGFGIQQKSLVFPDPRTPANQTEAIPYAVKGFTMGLTSSFLTAVDLSKLALKLKTLSPSLPSLNLQIPSLVEGFARGAVDGLFDGISAAGGLSNFIAGKISPDAFNKTEPAGTQFNDSVGGAAVAFGRGLTNEAVLQVGFAISKKNNPTLARRDVTTDQPILNATFLNFLLQEGANAIQCTGFGGVGSILMGLRDSKTLSANGFALDNSTLGLLPSDPLTIETNGNHFKFSIQTMMSSIEVNGVPMNRFISLTVVHVLFSVIALGFAFPIFLVVDTMHQVTAHISSRQPPWMVRTRNIALYFVVPVFSFAGMIVGFIGMGNSRQLRTPHGILGLLTTLLLIVVAGVHFLQTRKKNSTDASEPYLDPLPVPARPKKAVYTTWSPLLFGIMLILGYASIVLGFDDLRSFSMCMVEAALSITDAILIGSFVTFMMFVAAVMLGVRVWADRNLSSKSEILVSEEGEKTSQRHDKF